MFNRRSSICKVLKDGCTIVEETVENSQIPVSAVD
jgi:hypothetical protein